MGQGASRTRTEMAARVSPAVKILTKLGMDEATAKNNVEEGKINLYPVREKVTDQNLLRIPSY